MKQLVILYYLFGVTQIIIGAILYSADVISLLELSLCIGYGTLGVALGNWARLRYIEEKERI